LFVLTTFVSFIQLLQRRILIAVMCDVLVSPCMSMTFLDGFFLLQRCRLLPAKTTGASMDHFIPLHGYWITYKPPHYISKLQVSDLAHHP